MLSEQFWKIIDQSPIGRYVAKTQHAFNELDPQRIYVENVRALLGVPTGIARTLCDMAVLQGWFVRYVGYRCPQCRKILASFPYVSQPPEKRFFCDICQLNEEDQFEFSLGEVKRVIFYGLSQDAD
jgi:hypothetical protein